MLPKVLSLKLALVSISILCAAAVASVSSSEDAMLQQQCPTVSVTCAREKREGPRVTFQAEVQHVPRGQAPSYEWKVSAGSITDQKDNGPKSVITVDARGVAGGDITATVTVGNVGSLCSPADDCTTHIKGTAPANSPPTITSMGASPSSIVICSKDPTRSTSTTIELIVGATDPNNEELTYSWSVTGGRVVGEGRSVKWELGGVEPGRYIATVTVSDGRNEATRSTSVTVTTCE